MTDERSRRLFLALSATLLLGYGALLCAHRGTGVGGADSAGYANTARDVLSGRIVSPVPGLDRLGLPDRFDLVFIPLAFSGGPRARTMVPNYPPGFPLHVALSAVVAGWQTGPFLVSPVAAVLCLPLMFLLGRELGLSRPLAFAGAAMLGGCPVFLYQAVQPMSDIAAAGWALAAVLCALRSRRSELWACAAGASLGMAVIVRPTNAMLLVPVSLALSWRRRSIGLFVLGGLPFAGFYAAWNRAAFGSATRTGYSGALEHELSLSNLGPRFRYYGLWIVRQLSPLVPVGWLAAAGDRRIPVRDRAMLFLWFASFLGLYCCWGPYEHWALTRFLLPALPALIVAFLLVVSDLTMRLPEGRRPWERGPSYRSLSAAALLLVVAVFERRMERHLRPLGAARGQVVYPDACRALAARATGRNALVVSMEFSGAVRFYTDLTPIRWDWLTPEDFALVRARAAERGERIFAALLPYEIERARPRVPGGWRFLGNVRKASLWELDPGS